MGNQTISLFRYFLLGIFNKRLAILVIIVTITGLLLAGFVKELAIINSKQIASSLMADYLRYSFVLLAMLLVISNVAEDFESKQFERLLTMPISRWQYIIAQLMVIAAIAVFLILPVLVLFTITAEFEIALYWSLALWMEIFLVGLLGLLAILSLEKIPQAMFFTLAIYLLAKLSAIINQMLAYSIHYSDGSTRSEITDMVFQTILHVIPRLEAFAQNDLFYKNAGYGQALIEQSQAVSVYAVFILAVCMIDFYRKEFNL